jgi:hypothetical protein
MACVLTASSKFLVNCQGPTGSQFTIGISADSGLIGIESAVYGPKGKQAKILAGRPFTFTILEGINDLSLLGTASVPNVQFQVFEDCSGGADNPLAKDAASDSGHFLIALVIEGV